MGAQPSLIKDPGLFLSEPIWLFGLMRPALVTASDRPTHSGEANTKKNTKKKSPPDVSLRVSGFFFPEKRKKYLFICGEDEKSRGGGRG